MSGILGTKKTPDEGRRVMRQSHLLGKCNGGHSVHLLMPASSENVSRWLSCTSAVANPEAFWGFASNRLCSQCGRVCPACLVNNTGKDLHLA